MPTQKLSLRRKTSETPKAAETPVEANTAEVDETPAQPAPAAPKRLVTKKITPPAKDEDIVEAEVSAVCSEDDHTPSEAAIVSYKPMAMGQIDGAISERDLMRPRVNMVQSNSSELESKGFTVGQIVLNGEVLVWDKGYDPLKMILMTGRKKFIQRLTDEEYKAGNMPMIFDSPKDAENAGFSVNWDGNQPPAADPGLFCLFLLEQPEYIEPDPIFSLEHADRKFCLAEMKFTGVNYRSSTAARWLMTQSQTSLIPDTRLFTVGLTCNREKQKSGNIVTVASFRNLGRHKDPGFAEWAMSLG